MALPSILSQIYSTLLLLAIISLTIWLSLSKILSVYRQIPLPTAILDALGFFLFAAICFINCLFEDFLYRHTLSLVRTSLNKTVNFLEFTNRNNKQTIVKVLTYLATFVTFWFYYFHQQKRSGFKGFQVQLSGNVFNVQNPFAGLVCL
jgi:hypothetical protein